MLTLLFLVIWRTVATIHGYAYAYAPTNIAIAYLRSPRGLKWALPAALIAVPTYLCVSWLMTALVNHGAPEWLYLITLVAWIDVCKYAALALFAPFLSLHLRMGATGSSGGRGRRTESNPGATSQSDSSLVAGPGPQRSRLRASALERSPIVTDESVTRCPSALGRHRSGRME